MVTSTYNKISTNIPLLKNKYIKSYIYDMVYEYGYGFYSVTEERRDGYRGSENLTGNILFVFKDHTHNNMHFTRCYSVPYLKYLYNLDIDMRVNILIHDRAAQTGILTTSLKLTDLKGLLDESVQIRKNNYSTVTSLHSLKRIALLYKDALIQNKGN